MPAAKRKSSSKSPRSKKAKEEVADALTENEISMQSEDTSDAKTEDQTVNGSGDDSVGVTENTEVASSNSNHEETAPTGSNGTAHVETEETAVNVVETTASESIAVAPVSYQTQQTTQPENQEQQQTMPEYNSQNAASYAVQNAPTYTGYDMQQYNVTYQNPLTFGAPVAMMQTQQIVGNPGEDFSQPPPPPPPPSGDPEPKPELPQPEELKVTIEEDHKIYVAPKRRTLALNEGLLGDLKNAFKESEIEVVEVQCQRRTHAFLKVGSHNDVEKACNDFDDKLISGVIWSVKRRIGRAELHSVSFKPSNSALRVDEEMAQEVAKYVKDASFHVLRHYSTRDGKEVIIGLETEEEQADMVSKLGNVVIGHIAYTVSVKEDVQPEDSDDPDSEPFLFASIRGDDSKFFDANLVACVKKLLEDENIELTKSTVTSNCRFAFFFLTKWEDATKFVEKYDNKIINESPLHFEKGQPKSQRENRPARFNRGGGGGYSGPSRGRGGYFDGGYNRPPRGGPNSYYGGGGYNNRGGGGGYGYQQHPPQIPGPYGYSPYAYGGGYAGGPRGGGGYYNYHQPQPRGGAPGYGRW